MLADREYKAIAIHASAKWKPIWKKYWDPFIPKHDLGAELYTTAVLALSG